MTDSSTESCAALLEEMIELLKLNEENIFKIRAFEKAVQSLQGHSDLKKRAASSTLTEIPGIGKGIASVLEEYLLHHQSTERDALRAKLPEGLWELTRLSGVGPKKAHQLIEHLGVRSIGELEYACRENRVSRLSGFGEKAQAKILDSIQFYKSQEGLCRLDEALEVAPRYFESLREWMRVAAPQEDLRIVETGLLRRRMEVLDQIDFLIELPTTHAEAFEKKMRHQALSIVQGKVPVVLHFSEKAEFGRVWVQTSSSVPHWEHLVRMQKTPQPASTEEKFYASCSVEWIAPECREDTGEFAMEKKGELEKLVKSEELQGVFHAHSTASDGKATLEEMVLAARDRGYRYFGISDHSQSAFYAQGLKEEALRLQEKEVRRLQEKYPEIRIFWGIESDILGDGSLDYDDAILKRFDFVIASIHSRFQMGRAEMTQRILKAIRHPATRMVGHLTGRLLLGRPAFECDVEAIIKEAAQHDVAIELNAHPARLDIDWRWGAALRSAGTRISINPDAHEISGLDHTAYGVLMARKALLSREQVVNTMSTESVVKWLARK